MNQILEYYSQYDEDTRLKRHPVEFYTTTFILDKFLKSKNAILDVATGTGVYAIHYAKKGCSVIATDIVPKHIEILKSKIVGNKDLNIQCSVLDARDLSNYNDKTFDVVLCMGPIYHVQFDDSTKCLQECNRVLKKDGIIVVSYINKYNGFEKDKYSKDLYFYSESEIDNMISSIGFQKLLHAPVDGDVFNDFSCYLQKNPSVDNIYEYLTDRTDLFNNPVWKTTTVHGLVVGRK